MDLPVVRISVRAVVETTLHESDLVPAAGAARRMREGAAAHKARQSGALAQRADYRAETALEATYDGEGIRLRVTGRADGLYLRGDGVAVIEEIKLGHAGCKLIPAHMAQAAMYAHMLCEREGLERAALCVLYVNEAGEALECFEEERTCAQLKDTFCALCAPAAIWEARKLAHRAARDASLAQLPFPFAQYRAGQRRFAANAYIAFKERKRLFAQAPTGIGKTMAALYPALRALGEGKCARVVYLTARTTGRRSALDALARLSGADVLGVELAAKDKVCPMPARDCRPEICPYAAGFYDRLPAALECALGMKLLDSAAAAQLAKAHTLCPFELALEAAKLADVIVGDYNYVFDPFVSIDALLGAPGGAALLVDEAHQLAPRVRDGLSQTVSLDELRRLRRDAGREHGRKCGVYRALTGAIAALRAQAQEEGFETLSAPPESVVRAMESVQGEAAQQLSSGAAACDAEAFSLAASFLMAAERFDERYALLASGGEKHAQMTLLCLSAAPEIERITAKARGTVYFSATLTPFEAAKTMLGSGEGDACLALPSPFDVSQLRVSVAPVDIRYAARERTAPDVAQAIARHLRENEGNTIVYFPSYAYMARIREILLGEEGLPDTEFLQEARGMSEEERNGLLARFGGGERAVLLGVLGGAFSEGVDLPGRKLQNVIIVSTGLPQPDERVRAMQRYYDNRGEDGFALCMSVPGMVRVVQAAGRLIRTHEDTGSLLLIDSRYNHARMRALMAGSLAGEALALLPK